MLYVVEDSRGGITDSYLDGDSRSGQKIDNLLLNEYAKLYQRGGIGQYRVFIPQLPSGNQSVDSAYYFDDTIFAKSGKKLYYMELGDVAWTELQGPVITHGGLRPTGFDAFPSSEVGKCVSWNEWRGHLIATSGADVDGTAVGGSPTGLHGSYSFKVYRRASDSAWQLVQMGLPLVGNGMPITGPSSTPGAADQVIYRWFKAFVHEYTAKVNDQDVDFRFVGEPVEIEPISGLSYDPVTGGNTASLSFAGYILGPDENYDYDNFKVEAYRTIGNGFIPRLVKSVGFNTAIVDNVPDSDLGFPLYIGDLRNPVLPNTMIPRALYSELCDSRMYYFGCSPDYTEVSQTIPGDMQRDLIYESKINQLGAVPRTNATRLEGDCTGGGKVGYHPVAFTNQRSYRLEGHFDSFGNGNLHSKLISDSEGCLSNKGIVRSQDFLMFPSQTGFCWTDAYKVYNTTKEHLPVSYRALLNKQNISGVYAKHERKVYFAVESPDLLPAGVNNQIWVIDLDYMGMDDRGNLRACVTTMSSPNQNLQIVDLQYDEDLQQVVICDKRGYLLALDDVSTVDLVVQPNLDVDQFETQAILPHFISSGIRAKDRKSDIWITQILAVFRNTGGSLSVDLEGYDDNTGVAYEMKSVRKRAVVGIHKFKRWWKKGKIRGFIKQFGIKKGSVNIFRSDDYDTATVSGTTVTLDSGSWPLHSTYSLVSYYIYFDTDGYVAGHLIDGQSGANLTVTTPPGDGAAKAWEVRGVPKDERWQNENITVKYNELGEAHSPYRKADDGSNS